MSEDLRPAQWAQRLKDDWERRSRSPSRDFYVASFIGWDDPEKWLEQAKVDLDFLLLGFEREAMRDWEVLEIGCGVGRLVPALDGLVKSYTGFDIAPGMIEEARERCADQPFARFAVSDGLGIPAEVRDRRYDLVMAQAVFIHCPKEVIAQLLREAYELIVPGGEVRFQVRADPQDLGGLEATGAMERAEESHEQMQEVEVELTPEQLALIQDMPYMGHTFRWDELVPFVAELTDGDLTRSRTDLAMIYGKVIKPGAPRRSP